MGQSHEKLFPIFLTGKVVHGKGLGRTVAMPTANLCPEQKELPEEGVYASYIMVGERRLRAVTNVGTRPSVDQENVPTIESHILDFDENIYGQRVELELVQYLRPIRKFAGLDEVWEQVKKDIKEAKKILT